MIIVDQVTTVLTNLAATVPLEIFVAVGSVVEEIIAPIPSPLVMVLAGSLAHAQNHSWLIIILLALIGAVGKTFGAWFLYVVADRLEDVVIGKLGKFMGVSHTQIEGIGKRFNGGWQDNVFLFIARALPIVPSAPVSLACGVIKINLRTYLSSTFLGTIVRNMLYLYLGYTGFSNYKQITADFENIESIGQILVFVVLAGILGFAYLKRQKHE
jgi:membrane protein DedA with SNARE-associated domain